MPDGERALDKVDDLHEMFVRLQQVRRVQQQWLVVVVLAFDRKVHRGSSS